MQKLNSDQKRVLDAMISEHLQAANLQADAADSAWRKRYHTDLKDGRVQARMQLWVNRNHGKMLVVDEVGKLCIDDAEYRKTREEITERICGEYPPDPNHTRIDARIPALGDMRFHVNKTIKPRVDAINEVLNSYVLGDMEIDVMDALRSIFSK